MVELKDKVAIVSGAASGIGRAVAKELAKKGCSVVIVDLNEAGLGAAKDELEALGSVVMVKKMDCSKKENWQELKGEVLERFGQIDILINNAGVALGRVKLLDVSEENFRWVMDINFWGMVHATMVMLPVIKERNWGCIANVSSVFGLMGIPFQIPYCSSKFAIRGFSEALRMEGQESFPQINILSIFPGGINTNIMNNARWSANNSAQEIERTSKMANRLLITPASKLARQIVSSIERNKSRLVSGNNSKMLDFLPRVFGATYPKIFNFFFKKKVRKTAG